MTAATLPATGTSTWTIDPAHSLIEFSVKHLMIATVKGRFGEVTGNLQLDDSDLTRSTVVAEIDAGSIDTRQSQRDQHLRSPDFFDVERWPKLSFRSRRIEHHGDGLRVIGDLTIRDATHEVVLDVTEEGRSVDGYGRSVAAFSARTQIDRTRFGLTWNMALETGGILVGNDVKISLELSFIQQ